MDDTRSLTAELDAGAGSRRPTDTVETVFVLAWPTLVRTAALILGDADGAQDVVQEAYLRVRGRRFSDEDHVRAYLHRTVVNLCASAGRRRRLSLRWRPDEPVPPGDMVAEVVQRAEVVAALRSLPRRQREAVVLRYFADLTETQTADILGVSVGAVRAYTGRGRSALLELMGERS